ncbi:putative nuclease HARBI1 [Folsomia candida]|uniref:Putative nuclease HARBI1 n=1 Tax=Folsomia candida TaxID=158441 RepID=A0A226DVB2_FOLCA|nr:putative nuclease HARBI1 [Folsomia candida]OXA48641.1 putative nuclease HARBI1 [Folsomia candida]
MSVPLFVLRNERNRRYPQRKLLESLSEFEIRKHTGLPWWGAREILGWLEPHVEPKQFTNHAVTAESKVPTTLGFFRSGGFQWLMGSDCGLSQPTASRIIEQVSRVLVTESPKIVSFPDAAEQKRISTAFHAKSRFPNIIGIMDGSHVNIISPSQDERSFVNRKQNHSINVQIICDDQFRFIDAVASNPGGAHDSFVFRNSHIHHRFLTGEFGNGKLIGDSGYSRSPFMEVPYARGIITPFQNDYNKRLTSVRCAIECTIGRWKRPGENFAILQQKFVA